MKSKPSSARAQKQLTKHLEQINLYAAGIDIGSESHYMAVPEGLDDEPVRSFSCFTGDLEKLADWQPNYCHGINRHLLDPLFRDTRRAWLGSSAGQCPSCQKYLRT